MNETVLLVGQDELSGVDAEAGVAPAEQAFAAEVGLDGGRDGGSQGPVAGLEALLLDAPVVLEVTLNRR